MTVATSDGSRVVGTSNIEKVRIETEYTKTEILLSQVRSVECLANGKSRITFQNGDSLSGRLAEEKFDLKTIFGQIVVPIALVQRIDLSNKVSVLPEGLVLHYSFDTPNQGKVADASPSGNHGTPLGAVDYVDGKSGTAANERQC